MQFLAVSVIVGIFFFNNGACGEESFWDRVLKQQEQQTVVTNNQLRDFTSAELDSYLKGLLEQESFGNNAVLTFPRSLINPKFKLFDGKINRYNDGFGAFGFYDNIIFHKLDDIFFGALQVYLPQIDISFRYETNINGQTETGSFSTVISHEPIHLQMDFGTTDGSVCRISRNGNTGTFMFDKVNSDPKYSPDSPGGQRTAEQILQEQLNTWIPQLYHAILNVKVEEYVRGAKEKMLTDKDAGEAYKRFCSQTVAA